MFISTRETLLPLASVVASGSVGEFLHYVSHSLGFFCGTIWFFGYRRKRKILLSNASSDLIFTVGTCSLCLIFQKLWWLSVHFIIYLGCYKLDWFCWISYLIGALSKSTALMSATAMFHSFLYWRYSPSFLFESGHRRRCTVIFLCCFEL